MWHTRLNQPWPEAVHEIFKANLDFSEMFRNSEKTLFSYRNYTFFGRTSHYEVTIMHLILSILYYVNEPTVNELCGHHPVLFSGPSWNTEHHPIMFLPHLEDGCLTASPSPVGWSEFHDFRKLPWKMEKKRWMILGNYGDLDGFSGKPSTLEIQWCLERLWYHWKPSR